MASERLILRRVLFRPYRDGARFALTTYDTGRYDGRGQSYIGYRLVQTRDEAGKRLRPSRVVFAGEDFAGSPCDADDSDATVAALMVFLTLRPGDADEEYFAGYTPEQMDFAIAHGFSVGYESWYRFSQEGTRHARD